jgi:hypothetical protein
MLCFVAVLGVFAAQAQIVTPLIQFTNVWKFDQSGGELGTAWRTNDYDDSEWPSGPGLLGAEPDTPAFYTIHAPISTPLAVSSTVTTFYFRTTFEFTSSTVGLSLLATNLVDDGCAIYLNGLFAGSVRAPATYNANTFFMVPTTEGQLDVVALTNLSALRPGTNLLAVEVHQAGTPNSDIMWGMKLVAIQQMPLTITNQPQSQAVTAGDVVTLSVGVSGGPAFYRWQKDGVTQPSTSNTLKIASAQVANSGNYRVTITNSISAVTSSVATLTVIADLNGPRLIAAIGANSTGGGTFASNTINVFFSETLSSISAQNTNSYTVTQLGITNRVPVLRAIYSQTLGVLLTVDATDPAWIPRSDYILTVSGVKDTQGNVIAPNSQIAVAWLKTSSTNVSLVENIWSFHTAAIFDPGVYDQPWQTTNYTEGSWWAQGQGLFFGGAALGPCSGAFRTPMGYQPEPSLFRTTFLWPTDWRTSLQLRFATIYNDGLVLYLNGMEIWRANIPAGPVTAQMLATSIPTTTCTNLIITVTNLFPGTNWLAAAVAQTSSGLQGDSVFGLQEISAIVMDPIAPPLPETPPPTLNANSTGGTSIRLWWTGGAYALESATNLSLGSASYPLGPWQEVTNMSNPYTNSQNEPQRFFRLKK